MKILLLWDIDGTLLDSRGAGMLALGAALHNAFGITDLLENIEYAGKTDGWIMRQIFAKVGLPATEENFARYIHSYIAVLPEEMARRRARVLPGVRDLLETTAGRSDFAQGLLTGNVRRGAEVKLRYHGLWQRFPFGAFGDDSEFRNELGPHALRRAREHHGVDFAPERVWIIGDTGHDVECARAIGARALAVATGLHSADELSAHRPDAVLPDLSDTSAFWRIVGAR
jgi:phosphoglycolate phosphatase-like HAD superfamily hydrolase